LVTLEREEMSKEELRERIEELEGELEGAKGSKLNRLKTRLAILRTELNGRN